MIQRQQRMQEWAEAMRAAGMQPQSSNYPVPNQQGRTAYPGQPFHVPPGYPGQVSHFHKGKMQYPATTSPVP